MKTTTGTYSISGIARVASIGAIASVISITSAVAQPHQNYNINRRAQKQESHIQYGMKSGSLSATEAAQLKSKELSVDSKLQSLRAANGGHLTTQERHEALRAQNRLAREIYQMNHNTPALSAAPLAADRNMRGGARSANPLP